MSTDRIPGPVWSGPRRTGGRGSAAVLACVVAAALSLALPDRALAQKTTWEAPPSDTALAPPPAGQAPDAPKRPWNELDLGFTTVRLGAGLLLDMATYSQDEESAAQIDVEPAGKMRDGRVYFSGTFATDWPLGWSLGLMYDEPTRSWRFRQTGLRVGLPRGWGSLFIGRTKEGVSANKVLVGYYGWTMERFPFSDAAIPILADGVRWYGYLPDRGLSWNLGLFTDWQAEFESFSKDEHLIALRVAWSSISADTSRVLHIGVNARAGQPNDDKLRLRARPEAFPAPFFIDTGAFPATGTLMAGPELYYQNGPWFLGSEYYVYSVDSREAGDPVFHGGDVFVTRLLTGGRRAYNPLGTFGPVIPTDPVFFQGGPGTFEAVLRLSYTSLDGGTIEGGSFWRVTPMINWYLSEIVRFEFAYGYGVLDRFDLEGRTHFFQSRLSLTL